MKESINKYYALNELQKEVLNGTLLGDAHLEPSKNVGTARLTISRKAADKEYLLWQYNIFKDICGDGGFYQRNRFDKRYNKTYKQFELKTRCIDELSKFRDIWYPGGTKIVPNNLILTPLVCAVWFADDGCVIKNGINALTLKIATDGFGYTGAKLLTDKLQNVLDIEFPIYNKKQKGNKNKDLWFIKSSTEAAVKFIKYIGPVFGQLNMNRKSNIWKDIKISELNFEEHLTKYTKTIIFDENEIYIAKILENIIKDIPTGTQLYRKDLVQEVMKLSGKAKIAQSVLRAIRSSPNINCVVGRNIAGYFKSQ